MGGGLFLRALVREGAPLRPHWDLLRKQLVLGRDLLVRGVAFQICFLSATAVAARFGAASRRRAPDRAATVDVHARWPWTRWRSPRSRWSGRPSAPVTYRWPATPPPGSPGSAALCGLAFAVVIGARALVLPKIFTTGSAASSIRRCVVWPWFVGMLPLGGVVFALDGVFIGAGDARYLRNLTIIAGLCGFLPAIWLSL